MIMKQILVVQGVGRPKDNTVQIVASFVKGQKTLAILLKSSL